MVLPKANISGPGELKLREGETVGTVGRASIARDLLVCVPSALAALALWLLSSAIKTGIVYLLSLLPLSQDLVAGIAQVTVIPLLLLAAAAVIRAAVITLKHRSNYVYITDLRVITGSGSISLCADLSDIKNVSLEKGLGGKMLGYGTLNIVTKGGSVCVEEIDNADAIYKILMYHAENN